MRGMTSDAMINPLVSAVSAYNAGDLRSRSRQFEYIKETGDVWSRHSTTGEKEEVGGT
jgi:hypothetical protein